MRPQQTDEPFGELRQLVVELLLEAAGQEGEALMQSLDVWIGSLTRSRLSMPAATRQRVQQAPESLPMSWGLPQPHRSFGRRCLTQSRFSLAWGGQCLSNGYEGF